MELYLYFSYMPFWYAQANFILFFILFYIDIFWRGLYINYIEQVWHLGRFYKYRLIELHRL